MKQWVLQFIPLSPVHWFHLRFTFLSWRRQKSSCLCPRNEKRKNNVRSYGVNNPISHKELRRRKIFTHCSLQYKIFRITFIHAKLFITIYFNPNKLNRQCRWDSGLVVELKFLLGVDLISHGCNGKQVTLAICIKIDKKIAPQFALLPAKNIIRIQKIYIRIQKRNHLHKVFSINRAGNGTTLRNTGFSAVWLACGYNGCVLRCQDSSYWYEIDVYFS